MAHVGQLKVKMKTKVSPLLTRFGKPGKFIVYAALCLGAPARWFVKVRVEAE
ncbi:hypothetical protein [Thioclava sp.]|uniref:hypothetical protein n=1 Tax=Thioclava sp. TaxID=1933450 RepID=UPI0032426F4D